MERHEYEPCTHEGRHGYTLLSDPVEHEFCERCRRGPEAHEGYEDDIVRAWRTGRISRKTAEGMLARAHRD